MYRFLKFSVFVTVMLFVVSCATTPAGSPSDTSTFEGAVRSLAIKLQPSFDNTTTKPSAAIMNFTTENNANALEQYTSSILFEQFFSSGKMRLVERENIDKLLSEQNFQLSGTVDDDTAKSIGKIIGVDYVCYGTIMELGEFLRISGKIVNIQTGEIVSVASVNAPKDATVSALLGSSSRTVASSQTESVAQNTTRIGWTITRNRNEFDGYTTITVLLPSAGPEALILGYDKYDDPSRSLLRVGMILTGTPHPNLYSRRTFDIKADDGTISTEPLQNYYWSTTTGWKRTGVKYLLYTNIAKTRFLLNMFLNNNNLTFRRDERIVRFSTFGLATFLGQNGITATELHNALANEEF